MVALNDEDLPIDIQIKKLLDWLISRRICAKTWHDDVIKIREKISSAILDMPEHPEIKKRLSGARINYFIVLEIIEILKETEKDSKNFLGMYGSQRMKDWKDICSSYTKGNVHIGEASQFLIQTLVYDIPALKKRLSKCISLSEECEKSREDSLKRSGQLVSEFFKSTQALGLSIPEGDTKKSSIKKAIIELLSALPSLYDELAKSSYPLEEPRAYYEGFVRKSLKDESALEGEEILPLLNYLIHHGNVTTYEWIHGEPPVSVEAPVMDFGEMEDEKTKTEQEEEDVIDFGDDEIDFGDKVPESTGEIDWGDLGSGEESTAQEVEIDWDAVEMGESIIVEEGGIDGGVARNEEALSLLDNRRTRTLLLDELHELECFLEQREADMKSAVGGASSLNAMEDTASLQKSIARVRSLIEGLTSSKMHHLQSIRSSPKYVDRIVENLRSKINLSDKMKYKADCSLTQREEALQESVETKKRLDVILEQTKILQSCICKDISQRYNDRKVNIMGGIQSIIS
eukprot:TRINITY_DN2428_c0_g1_i1.p1 TRINITY_DN2428_c0_g1~~TRINITY_DN2428_c0_g1_i1.p1  ORF type:complete len:516 (+),score=165.94 TRINITY_DN2428_c0_g1_i1:71-1618(+)